MRGQLVDRENRLPIGGAFVGLLDQAGLEVARALTGAGGAFWLLAPAAGTYHLRSKRIGFRPTESPPFALADSQTMDYRLEVEAIPVRLPAVIVPGLPQCGTRGDEGSAVAQLWEDAREALAAVKWTEDQSTLRYVVERFERDLPTRGRQVIAEHHTSWSGYGEKPFESIPAEQLAGRGFVVASAGDSADYYGPDAEVLLGDVFVRTHCFRPRDGGIEHADLVGLAFEPAPGRKLPDVAGVLWLDRETLELRFLEFEYTRLRARAGGYVAFASLPSGAWIVSDWWIRTPQLNTAGRRRRVPQLLGFHEEGGMVTTISSPGGVTAYSASGAVLEGAVVDSTRNGALLADAAVVLVGTDRAAGTNANGRFRIAGPMNGDYGVLFRHPRLDSLGAAPDTARVRLVTGVHQAITLFVPREDVLLERLCPGKRRDGGRAIVGVVRDSTGASVAGARIHVQISGREPETPGKANRAGRYIVCGVPSGGLRMWATAGKASSREVILQFNPAGVWIDGTTFRSWPSRIWTQFLEVAP